MVDHFLKENGLYFVPLGGSEQFGVNLNVYACDGALLAIDCGIGFADESFPGIDILLPDPSLLEENKDKLAGMVITHAHEDHIGAVHHLWDRFECPIYCTPFTASVLKRKLDERDFRSVPIHEIEPDDSVDLGPYHLEFLPVSHSVPDTCSIAVKTQYGRVIHSGDWNLDPKPVVGYKTDAKKFKSQGDKGVLAYIGDSTNAGVPGLSGSEEDVAKGLAQVIKECSGKVAVTTFSSNIGRIISIYQAAKACGREVGVIGRSMHAMIGSARSCGYLEDIGEFLNIEDLGYLPSDKQLMIVTGSQGEGRAALSKISRGEHPEVSLGKGDEVIFSARAIPGNETDINAIKNNLVAAGVTVISPGDTQYCIHVSGHPCQDEISQMYQWLRPELVIPVHGERVMLEDHARLAKQCQITQTIIPNNGSVIKLAPGTPELMDHIETGLLAVDQRRLIASDHSSITERRKLQYTGTIHVSLALNGKGKIVGDPQMDTVGLYDLRDESEENMEERLYNEIFGVFEQMKQTDRQDDDFVAEELRIGLRRFCQHTLGFKPKTNVHILRI